MLAALAAATPPIQASSCTPPPAGMVGWWKGDGTAVDVVSSNNGVLVNINYTNGVDGQAFACDPESYPYGTYCGVQIADEPAYALTNALTIEGWIRPRGDGYNIFWRGDNRPGLDPYLLSMQGGNLLALFITDANGNYDSVGAAIAYGNWVHVAATYDGSIGLLSLYTNGVLAAQKATTIRPFGNLIAGDSPGVGIGNVNDGFNNFPFLGDIDEIALYNRALAPAEILAIYNAGSAGKCTAAATACTPPPAGIVGWWPAEANANDIVGTNNGVLQGGVGFATGEVNQAFNFNNTNGDVFIPASASLNVGTAAGFTLEAWINPTDVTATHPLFEWNDGNYWGVHFHIAPGQPFNSNPGPGELYANIVSADTSWHQLSSPGGVVVTNVFQHVALTYDQASGVAMIYCNGQIVGQQNIGSFTPLTTEDLYLGQRPAPSAERAGFVGLMDEPAIYNRALSSNEIAAIYLAGSAGKCTSATISSGPPTIFNFSPNSGSNGTIVAITGTNFSATAASNIVYFGAVRAAVLAASPTSLTVTVPSGATFAPITVSVGGLIAYANAPFLVTFPGGGSAALAPRLDLPAMDGPGQVAYADLDGDGRPDLVVASGNQGISIYQNLSTNGTVTAASFAPPVNIPLPTGLQAMIVADVDGDGKLDILFLNRNSSQVAILKNISTPGLLTTNSFAAPVAFATGSDPRGVAVQDLDGDGKPEIIVANWGDSTVSVLHNTGAVGLTTNSFAAAVTFAVGANPQSLAVADLDGDGKPDVVTANNNYGTTNSVSILRNTSTTGNISFAPSVGLTGMPTCYGIAVADLDGDGKLDIVVSSFINGQAVSVYRNMSSPGSLTINSFAPNVDFSAGGWGNAVAISDLDGDGKPDIAVVTQLPDHLSIFKNISTPGSFTTSSLAPRVDYPTGWNPNGVAIGDLDGDGRPDIAFAVSYAATLSIYQNQTPTAGSLPSTNPPAITAVAPLIGAPGTTVSISGTNFYPLAASNIVYFGAVQAVVSSASPTSLTVTVPSGATFGPITVTVNGKTAISGQPFEPTFNGNGSSIGASSFAPSFNLGTAYGPGSAVIADLDGDGKPDIALVTGGGGVVSIFKNISTNGAVLSAASFAPRVDLPFPTNGTGGNPYRLRAVDLDGDGKLDLIACEVSGNRVSVFHNIATPGTLTTNSFEPGFALIAGNDCRFAAAADLDGDGRVDIVALNYGDKTISLFKNIGTAGSLSAGSFAPPVVLAAPGGPYEAVIADLDGDGKLDLAVANSDSGTVSIFQNVATPGVINTNTFAASFDLPCGNATATITAADLDGDGKLDLIAGSVQSETISVFQNVSAGGLLTTNSFAPRVDFGTGYWTHTVAIADFNGDGKPDIGVVGELPSVMSIFQNISTPGSFTAASLAPRVDFGTGWNAWGIAAGDLDGDGRPDIVFCNDYDSTIQIYQNVAPFGTGPVAPAIINQPTNFKVTVNGTAVFNIAANGTAPLNYQWTFNGTNLVGATNATLILTNVQSAQAGNYFVTVTNLYGAAVSSNALLTVVIPQVPPVILAQTPSQVVLLGNPATFSVAAGGSSPLSYFWLRNGVIIPGATNFSYVLNNSQLSDSGSKFSCLVTNAYGSTGSTNVSLKVIDSTVANDLCSGAILITNASYTNFQSTVQATSFGDPVPDCVDGFGHGVWYQFTAPVAGQLVVDTFGSDFDTGLAVYTGSCDALTEVTCNDDAGGVTSQVILPTAAGATYFILAGGYSSDAGNLVLHLNHLTPPAFVLEPTNTSVVVSSNASFSTALVGTLPMSFQWFFNNTPLAEGGRISGSTNSTLNIANVQTNDGGNYFLVASNFVGVTTSSVAVLTPVILPPVFLQQPVSQSLLVGSNANFFAVVDGTPPYSYQWSLNGNALTDDGVHITGSATASLNISSLTTADAGNYTLTVTNVSGATNTTAAVLTVLVPPTITTQPVGRSVPPGLPTTFNAAVSGIPAPSYQWQLNGTNIADANSASYSIGAVGTNHLGFYQVVAINSVGSATSAVAQLTFGPVAAWGLNSSGECLPPPGLSNVIAVAGSPGASFAVQTSGNLVAWGSASAANLPASATNVVAMAGLGNYALRADGSVVHWAGLAVSALSNIVSVAGGNSTAGYAVRAEGALATWGNPTAGPNVPGLSAGLNHLTAIACGMNSPVGYLNAVALKNDGTIIVSGSGAVTNVPAGLSNVVAVAAGYTYAMALQTNGTVVAWGSGTATNLPAGMTNIVAISAGNVPGENFGLAIRNNGTVLAWGDDPDGETNPPAALGNLFSIAGAAAAYHGLALVHDGSPVILHPPVGLTANTGRKVTLQATAAGAQPLSYQWLLNGTNVPGATNTSLVLSNLQFANAGNYQLFVSNSINTAISLPAPVNVISNNALVFLTQTANGVTNYQGSTITVGSVTVLGNGPLTYQWFFSPTNKNYTAVPGATSDTLTLNPALALQSGNYYVAVSNQVGGITSAPVVVRVLFAKAWGYLATDAPFNLTNATAIAVGNLGTGTSAGEYLALSVAGNISAWGVGHYGETNVAALSNSIVTAIAAGYGDSLALRSDGTVYAWGDNSGLLTVGSGGGETNVPATAVGITAIACGDYHDLAVKSDGTVVGWGQNTYGQTTNTAATNVVTVAAGGQDSIALRADGSVTTWGLYGAAMQWPIPANATNLVAVAAGSTHFLGLRANGTVVGWGSSPYGQATIPTNWTNIVAVAAAGNHSLALRNDGTVLTLGNYYIGPILTSGLVPTDLANVVAIACGGDHDLALFGTRAPAITVQPWNRNVPVNVVTNLILAAKCAGVQPVRYQWQLNGTNLPSATNDTLALGGRSVTGAPIPISTGAYQLIASNAYGVAASKYAKVSTYIPLGDALDATNLTWITSGSAPWFGETNVTHDGVDAARSGGIGALQETILQTTFGTNQAGSYSFWWKVSSEQDFDILEFRINGIVQTNISGEVDWQQVSIPVAAGTNVLEWRYSKDATFDVGQDAGWVDQFAYLPAAPAITLQPVGQIVNYGTNVTLRVTATGGTPDLHYQWRQNGNLIGGNSPLLTLNNVARLQGGTYFVTVTNAGGSTVSSNAVLKVLVPQLLGSPKLLSNGTFLLTSADANGGLLSPANLANFEAQASTNLVNWVTLPGALSLTNGMLLLQDSGASFTARYYRIIEH